MVRDKFEKRGFVPRHETGKKHGIDASALNASKLYYLPCKRPDSFFQTYRVDAQPIVPIEWVQAASEDSRRDPWCIWRRQLCRCKTSRPSTRIVASKALRAISGV